MANGIEKLTRAEAVKLVEKYVADADDLREAVACLVAAGARRKTLVILLAHYTGLPQRTVGAVLDGINGVAAEYFGLEPEEPKK
jgi:hypothetical protein